MTIRKSIDKMLNLLDDRTVDVGGRDDIVLSLTEHGDETALQILHEIASKPKCKDDIMLIEGCGEAIARIMCRSGNFQYQYIKDLLPYKWGSALHSAIHIIQEARPDWYQQYNLEDLQKTKIIKDIKIFK